MASKRQRFNKYDIVEIHWLDSHNRRSWTSPAELEDWIKDGNTAFQIKTLGYFIHQDKDFIRVAQSFDHQSRREGSLGDNTDGLFAVSKADIKRIKLIKRRKKDATGK